MPWYCIKCDDDLEYIRRTVTVPHTVYLDYSLPEDPENGEFVFDGDFESVDLSSDVDMIDKDPDYTDAPHVAWECPHCGSTGWIIGDLFAWRDDEEDDEDGELADDGIVSSDVMDATVTDAQAAVMERRRRKGLA
jgi:hypothetical protein